MTALRYLSWENFRSTVFVPGQQRIHRVSVSPLIEVLGDGANNRIGLLIETPRGTTIPPEFSRLAFITTRILDQDGRRLIEVGTAVTSLYRHFYHFSVAVAERIVLENRSAVEAIALELEAFGDLLGEKPVLGFERQIGLLGELLFLQRLIPRFGEIALDAWLGPTREPHDFRLGTREFEVKTTVSPHRVHTIHGTEQLIASEGCALWLASVMLGPPGADDGFSLREKVEQLSRIFGTTQTRHNQFMTALEACGFRMEDGAHYTRRFTIRRGIGLVPVDNSFPALTRLSIHDALGTLAPRIDSLQYDVNVDGLEHEDGTAEFDAAIRP